MSSTTPTRLRREISPELYRKITVIAVIALSAIIVTGAGVRLTGSGLGCTDWPTCEENQFHPPLEFHAMIEFVNRLITGLVSAAVIAAVLGSLRRNPRRKDLTRWSWSLVVGVVAQILIGALVVFSELSYSTVAVHFLVSMVLVWAAMVLWDRAGRADDDTARRRWPSAVRALVAFATLVLISGSVVTSTGPHSGDDEATKRLPLDLGQTVRYHSLFVWLTCATVVLLMVQLQRSRSVGSTSEATWKAGYQLLIAVVAQGAIGYTQYFTGVPAGLVGLHVLGATVVWILTLRLAFAMAEPIAKSAPISASDARSTPHELPVDHERVAQP